MSRDSKDLTTYRVSSQHRGRDTPALPLLRAIFDWARDVDPAQPLTAVVWAPTWKMEEFQLEASDVESGTRKRPCANASPCAEKRQLARLVQGVDHDARFKVCGSPSPPSR